MSSKEVKKDIEELKASINMMGEQLGTISEQQRTIMGLLKDIQELKKLNQEQQNRINFLETRVADLEQYTRLNDVIISGVALKPSSYAHALRGAQKDESNMSVDMSVEEQVTNFLQSKDIQVDKNCIEACHTLPSKNPKTKSVIIMRFVNRKNKIELLRQWKKLRGTNVYINEHLTKVNADLARKARFLKKQGKIMATWTSNCKVFIKTNGSPEDARVICIRNSVQFENL